MCPHAQIREDNKIRCALVHDHVLLRQGLRRILEDEPDIRVVAEAGNVAEGLRKIFEHRPDVVVGGLHIFEREAHESERLILQESPLSKVLFLTTGEDANLSVQDAILSAGHAVRRTSAAELIDMIRRSVTVRETLSPEIRRRDFSGWPTQELLPRQRTLTVRERQVLKLLAEGRTVRLAASILGLSVKTVDAHKFNLMRKLGIHNKAELVMWAIQKRVLKLPVNL